VQSTVSLTTPDGGRNHGIRNQDRPDGRFVYAVIDHSLLLPCDQFMSAEIALCNQPLLEPCTSRIDRVILHSTDCDPDRVHTCIGSLHRKRRYPWTIRIPRHDEVCQIGLECLSHWRNHIRRQIGRLAIVESVLNVEAVKTGWDSKLVGVCSVAKRPIEIVVITLRWF
jgi:hypothetical protein